MENSKQFEFTNKYMLSIQTLALSFRLYAFYFFKVIENDIVRGFISMKKKMILDMLHPDGEFSMSKNKCFCKIRPTSW